MNLTGRKRERSTRREADCLSLGRNEIANGLEAALHLLQQAHRLKEMDAEGLFVEHLAKIG